MVASAIYFMDVKGKILLHRNYRGDIPRAAADKFSIKLQESDPADLSPVYTEEGITYVYLQHRNVYLLALTKRNSNVALILSFLSQIVQIMCEYFGELEEEPLRDNFVLVYELLDEVMDFGYPQVSETKVLKEYIMQSTHLLQKKKKQPSTAPQAVTNAVSWRSEGIKYKKNEVFLDVIEKVDLLASHSGAVLHSEIRGSVQMRAYLSGMPELKLGLNDKLMLEATGKRIRGKAIELEDIKFHQCVRLNRFEQDRTIGFIPPDGEFELMSYRLNTHVKPLIWVESSCEKHRNRLLFSVKAKSQFKARSQATDVEIFIPVPPDVDSPAFKTSSGSVLYLPDINCIKWVIKQFPGDRELLMRASFGLPTISTSGSNQNEDWKKPIRIKFEIPYFTTSGIQVRYLKVIEKSGYEALPWVRYITRNGEYQLRMK
eukprot:gb/GECG01008956.1/.p1 GENE.gb/GECG01008956.1/~~gb/GECG01008956.1/.p1  ORF type:complete len:430 (+),score=43.82 gb/GECG01008956.1/:1-1290(+)